MKNKKMKFEKPFMEIVLFEAEDIVVASGGCISNCIGNCNHICDNDCISVCFGVCHDIT